MKPAVLIVIFLALVAACGTGYFAYNYLDSLQVQAVDEAKRATIGMQGTQKPKSLGVLVAAVPIDVGKVIEPSMLEWQEWPESYALSISGQGVITAGEGDHANAQRSVEGALARVPLLKGQPFTQEAVIRREQGSLLPILLTPGHRSVTIPVDGITGAGGMIQPGDRVDIALTQEVSQVYSDNKRLADISTGGRIRPRFITETIMTDMKVIAADRRLAPSVAGPEVPAPTNVSFDATPEQAERLITANRMGRFTLLMRPLQDAKDPDREGPLVTTDVEVTPKTRAEFLNITPDLLNLKENPFYPVADKKEELAPVDTTADARSSIVIYHGPIPSTINLVNGHPVVVSGEVTPGTSIAPPAPVAPLLPPNPPRPSSSGGANSGNPAAPPMPTPPDDSYVPLPRNARAK